MNCTPCTHLQLDDNKKVKTKIKQPFIRSNDNGFEYKSYIKITHPVENRQAPVMGTKHVLLFPFRLIFHNFQTSKKYTFFMAYKNLISLFSLLASKFLLKVGQYFSLILLTSSFTLCQFFKILMITPEK